MEERSMSSTFTVVWLADGLPPYYLYLSMNRLAQNQTQTTAFLGQLLVTRQNRG